LSWFLPAWSSPGDGRGALGFGALAVSGFAAETGLWGREADGVEGEDRGGEMDGFERSFMGSLGGWR
jgi:hypothetical protein